MGLLNAWITANVTEPGDVVLVVFLLGVILVVGLALLTLDAVVGRFRGKGERRAAEGSKPPDS